LYEDNEACIRISKNPELHKRTKHIEIQWFYVRLKQQNNEIQLIKVDSENNIADLFPKALPRRAFYKSLKELYQFEYQPEK
jgi:hypothetical protein